MWLLESDGDVLEGKRIWLRPGKTYLFGRTHSRGDGAGKGFKIEHSTISRKHATVTVELPRPGDVTLPTARSGLKIEDLRSKHGIFLGDRKLSGESLYLQNDENSFRLGGFEETFTIKWHSVVFTFKPPSKDKDKKLLQEKRALLEPLDIKAIDKFDSNETTHVVSNKRNTPQTLQALVHAKYVVDDSVLKELEYVTTEGNLDEPESMSKLELDFDAGWPDPMKFLPAVTKEPNPKPAEYFTPDPSRNKVFSGYTFVMFDKKQYDGIQPAVVGGGGRAVLQELKIGQSSSADILRYMKEEYNAAESRAEGSGYGVLHVRLVVTNPAYESWATRIQTESVTATGQGLVEQNEFLEAILMKDARGMVKKAATQEDSLEHADAEMIREGESRSIPHSHQQPSGGSSASRTQVQTPSSEQAPVQTNSVQPGDDAVRSQREPSQHDDSSRSAAQAPSATVGRSRRTRVRAPVVSAFKGFVDDPVEPEVLLSEQAILQETRTTSTPEAQPHTMDISESMNLEEEPNTFQTPRKRPLPPEIESGEDMNARLYPAQAAAKRRRLEGGASPQQSVSPAPKQESADKRKASKANAEADYEAKMRKIREQQEEINDNELEPMHEQLEKMSFGERQRLVKIEEFEVKPRKRNLTDSRAHDSRWKDEWNGRKNFKGFKRRGQPAAARSGSRIIIALEPIPVESAAEQYLASKRAEAERRRAKRREEEEESEISQDFTDANTHLEEAPAELHGDGGPEIIDIDAPRTTRATDRGSQEPSRARTTAASLKRQASTATNVPAKKHKKLNLRMDDEDGSSEEDEIPKFRFKKK